MPVFVGTFINPVAPEAIDAQKPRQLEFLQDWAIVTDEKGFIVFSGPRANCPFEMGDKHVIESGPKGWFLPGFIDTHIHAPQYLNAGTALDKPLMEWLQDYTFAAERRIDNDPNGIGHRVYSKLVARMIEEGTTMAACFGTLQVEANLVLSKAFQEAGIRAWIGKVNMDMNGIDGYVETTAQSITRTKTFIQELATYLATFPEHLQLVTPVLTPRFVPTCSKELLAALREIMVEKNLPLMSHMSEAQDQVAWVAEMYNGATDVQILSEAGLLTSNSLMAHCTHATPEVLTELRNHQTSVAHCPLSNVYFSAERAFPLREALNENLSVGLGTDISGGYSVSMGESMRWATAVSRIREGNRTGKSFNDGAKDSVRVGWRESLWLATLGGAKALGMDDRVGKFAIGKAFDAQLVRIHEHSRIDVFDDIAVEELVEKWWCTGTFSDRVGVWVQGVRRL